MNKIKDRKKTPWESWVKIHNNTTTPTQYKTQKSDYLLVHRKLKIEQYENIKKVVTLVTYVVINWFVLTWYSVSINVTEAVG